MNIRIATTDPYREGRLFRTKTITINPGLTVLVGCNGAGKTTLLKMLKGALEKEYPDRVIHYDNLSQGGKNTYNSLAFHQRYDLLATRMTSSEGETITQCLGDVARMIGTVTRADQDQPVFILLDSIDSGLSIDHIIDLKRDLFEFACEIHPETYFITVANEYEMANGERCWDVNSSREIRFSDYEDYKEFILTSRKKKDKRYQAMRD